MNLHLEDYQARRLGWWLSLLCEWLHHSDERVLDELADFGFGMRTDPRGHLGRLIDELEAHARVLGRRPAPADSGGAA